jgi:hypothetical protein
MTRMPLRGVTNTLPAGSLGQVNDTTRLARHRAKGMSLTNRIAGASRRYTDVPRQVELVLSLLYHLEIDRHGLIGRHPGLDLEGWLLFRLCVSRIGLAKPQQYRSCYDRRPRITPANGAHQALDAVCLGFLNYGTQVVSDSQ